MTLTDWAALLLADCSDVNLLGFSDWLELDCEPESLLALSEGFADEEGKVHERMLTQAARGVRKRLVCKGTRPYVLNVRHGGFYAWYGASDRKRLKYSLESQAFRNLKNFTNDGIHWRWYAYTPATQALAHLTALLDAAQAWAKCNPEPLTKGKVTT